MKIYMYTYDIFLSEFERSRNSKYGHILGLFFDTLEIGTPDRINLGVMDVPNDAIMAALCSRDQMIQNAVAAFDAEMQSMRAECERKCLEIERRKQELLALEAS